MAKCKIATLNARGLNNTKKRISLFEWIREQEIDIVLIQESYCTKDFEKRFRLQWNGDIYHSYTNSKHAKGVCILVRKEFKGSVINIVKDNEGRKILIEIDIGGYTYTIVNLYCPTSLPERIEFLRNCIEWIHVNAKDDSNLIIGGDVNCVDWPSDRSSLETDKSSETLRNLKNVFNVTDIWKILNPHTYDYTYIDPSFRNRNSRIDILCASENIVRMTDSCEHKLAPCPDHKAVIMTFSCDERLRGKGYWKLNVSILKEREYVEAIKNLIEKTLIEYNECADIDKNLIWELIKIRVKEFSIKYCINRIRHRDDRAKIIETKITILDEEIQANGGHEDVIMKRKLLKQQLDDLHFEKGIGAHVRSRVKWIEEGERSTQYFIGVEKKRQNINAIKSLKENNVTLTEDTDILNAAKRFYTDLYSTTSPCTQRISEYIDNINLPNLSPEQQQECEGDITIQECEDAIGKIKANRSPGEDGIPIEFYKTFWADINIFLISVYNESFEKQKLPNSMRKSIVTLIHKKGDRADISNYRPISLTNLDYRILANILASRLQNVMSHIVDPAQVAYIKGRFIGNNIRLVHDIFDLYNEKNRSGIIMFADFEKAFDSIEWDFLFATLRKFNFGANFQQWIKILYTEPYAVIKNNGHISDAFKLTRGVRQGCPVSALLFVLCVEVLACQIRQNANIKGLNLDSEGNKNIKITQYADDATLFIQNTNEMKEVIRCLNLFGRVSGTKLNLMKCEGLWLGASKHRQHNCTMFNMRWPTEPIRYLGIFIGHDTAKCNKLNFENKLLQIDDTIQHLQKRNLTLFGKICVIKTFVYSKIIFVATCLSIPEKVIKEIDQRIFRYLWGKRDRVKRKSIINNIQSGGLNMIDVRSHINAIKASWVCRIVNAPENHLWAYLPKFYLSKFGHDFFILKTTVTHNVAFPDINTIPGFYKDIIFAYNISKLMRIEDFHNNLVHQPIWGNKFLTFKNKCLFFKSWIDAGITTMGNLRIVDGRIDVDYLMNIILNHSSFYREVNILQKAINKANITGNINPITYINLPKYVFRAEQIFEWENRRTKYFYNNILDSIKLYPTSEQYWINKTEITETEIHNSYLARIFQIKDHKLAETSFKILNNILPCNKHLFKWGKSKSPLCYFCKIEENISHLLFDCKNSKLIWNQVSNILNIEITHNMVLFGTDLDRSLNHVFLIIIYYIYKEFLVYSFEKKERIPLSIVHFKYYLLYRKYVYEKCSSAVWKDVCGILNMLIISL